MINSSVIGSLRGGSDDYLGRTNDRETNTVTPETESYGYISNGGNNKGNRQMSPPQMGATNHLPPSSILAPAVTSDNFVDMIVGNNNDPLYGYRETVEDRAIAWRRQQQVC